MTQGKARGVSSCRAAPPAMFSVRPRRRCRRLGADDREAHDDTTAAGHRRSPRERRAAHRDGDTADRAASRLPGAEGGKSSGEGAQPEVDEEEQPAMTTMGDD